MFSRVALAASTCGLHPRGWAQGGPRFQQFQPARRLSASGSSKCIVTPAAASLTHF